MIFDIRVLIATLSALAVFFGAFRPELAHASTSSATEAAAGGDPQASIVGGTPASIASYPWLAYIDYAGSVEKFSCGGTIVSPRLVLTAAHCVLTGTGKVAIASSFTVLAGTADRREATSERISRVSQVLVFPEYDPAKTMNDAALLVLATPVPVPPLPLATQADDSLLTAGTPVATAGWGLTSANRSQLPTILREGRSAVQSTLSCRRAVQRGLSTYKPSSQICIRSQSRPGTSVCSGDSGGPVVALRPDGTQVQIGIVSLGSFDCSPKSPQVLARVDRVSPWVAAWIAAIELGGPAPAIVTPRVELPLVTRRDAEFLAALGLEIDFGTRFTRGRYHGIECISVSREKVRCRVQWLRGVNFYRGGITIYSALPREGFPYNYRYTIRRFNVSCWLKYLHPIQVCNPRLFRR